MLSRRCFPNSTLGAGFALATQGRASDRSSGARRSALRRRSQGSRRQATEEAEQLAKSLGDGTEQGADPAIAMLRERLGLGPGRELPISTLRGQLADNRAWLLHSEKDVRISAGGRKEDSVVRQRLNAPKWLRVAELPTSADPAETMAQRAWEVGQAGGRVIVFCNSRKLAQSAHDDIEKRLGKHLNELFGKESPKSTDSIQLMVGARRVREREELARSRAFRRFSPKSSQDDARETAMPAFLIATSAGEVGVDIDADHMVCDLVAWERMVQRLGRVNRLGGFAEGFLIDVFAILSDRDKEAVVPVGATQIETWRVPFDSALWSIGREGRRDASPGALRRLREKDAFKQLRTPQLPPRPAPEAHARGRRRLVDDLGGQPSRPPKCGALDTGMG
jgi:CRISPR-associated nuclease/helicase Cas3, C-terminal